MKHLLFFSFLCLFNSVVFAHETNKAYFEITQKEDFVEVKAEFPWTIRNAFLKAFPNLKNSKNQEEFDASFFRYINNNLELSENNNNLKLVSVVRGSSYGHSHQNNYIFTFKGANFNTVKNTIMCNLSKSHKNYHTLFINDNSIDYITSVKNSHFKISENLKKNKNPLQHINYYYVSIFVIITGLIFFLYYRK